MYLSVGQAARALGVTPDTVRRWTSTGFLPCERTAGGHRRIAGEDVDELRRAIGGGSHLEARRAREREVDTLAQASIDLASMLDRQKLSRPSPATSRGSATAAPVPSAATLRRRRP